MGWSSKEGDLPQNSRTVGQKKSDGSSEVVPTEPGEGDLELVTFVKCVRCKGMVRKREWLGSMSFCKCAPGNEHLVEVKRHIRRSR